MSRPPRHARLVRHTYPAVPGGRATARPFFIVECPTCSIALNSGHHYSATADGRRHATRLARAHDAQAHNLELNLELER